MNKKELISYIRRLLKTNKSLTAPDKKVLKSALKELKKPGKPDPAIVIRIIEILAVGMSVGEHILQLFHR